MIVCERCLQALYSRGEVKRCSTVDNERLEELDIPIVWGYLNDDGDVIESEEYPDEPFVECEWCEEYEQMEFIREV